jgi:acetyl-CoA carboxylase biotin carboxyl carrier protein
MEEMTVVTLDEIRELVELVQSSAISELEITRNDDTIRIVREHPQQVVASAAPMQTTIAAQGAAPAAAVDSAPGDASATESAPSNHHEMPAPMVGTFYRSPSPESDAYIKVGDHVDEGQTVCIIEAMKLMNEIPADRSGTVVEICVENADPVEYGQALLRIQPD